MQLLVATSESELPEEVKIEGFENQNPTSEIRDDNLKESLAEKFNNIKAKNSSDEKEGDLELLEDEESEDFEEDQVMYHWRHGEFFKTTSIKNSQENCRCLL